MKNIDFFHNDALVTIDLLMSSGVSRFCLKIILTLLEQSPLESHRWKIQEPNW